MKTVVLHDYFRHMEGGGRLCLILAQHFKTDVGYGFKVKGHLFFDEYQLNCKEFDLGIFGYFPGWRTIRLIQAFRDKTRFVENYKNAIYSGFYAPMAASNYSAKNNIYYCHTPPRYIYDQNEFYLSRYPVWMHPIINSIADFHKSEYENAIKKMNCIVTNSFNVKKRIKKYLGIDAKVVYPPCETDKFKWISQDGFYLSAGRIDPLKRIDIIIDAFKKMPEQKLVIISGGPELKRIKRSAIECDNIKVMGIVSEKLYQKLVGKCVATIYIPKDEDFGMTPIESLAAGKPVIGVNEGGLKESITHNKTGVLLPKEPKDIDVIDAVRQLDEKSAKNMMISCQESAKQFDVKHFISKMSEIIN